MRRPLVPIATVDELLTEMDRAGCWTVLPTHTRELAPVSLLFEQMREAHVAALRIFPPSWCFIAGTVAMGDLLESYQAHVPYMSGGGHESAPFDANVSYNETGRLHPRLLRCFVWWDHITVVRSRNEVGGDA